MSSSCHFQRDLHDGHNDTTIGGQDEKSVAVTIAATMSTMMLFTDVSVQVSQRRGVRSQK
jgi:hypothetical protein